MPLDSEACARIARARLALEGLSVGDAFGQQFFFPAVAIESIRAHTPPPEPWCYTDDTAMAIAIFEVLRSHGRIIQDELASAFGRQYAADPRRGYGANAARLLHALAQGGDWRRLSAESFNGQGSLGNGAAMRVAPLGAYFADDFERVAEEAALSAEVTHFHPEGKAGAIAVAIATAWAWRRKAKETAEDPAALLKVASTLTPEGTTRDGILAARDVPLTEWEFTAVNVLGNGSQITAADTVPFCLWCAAAHLDDYAEALWTAVRVGGDCDTNAAIVGGIVAMSVGEECIPLAWRKAREPLECS